MCLYDHRTDFLCLGHWLLWHWDAVEPAGRTVCCPGQFGCYSTAACSLSLSLSPSLSLSLSLSSVACVSVSVSAVLIRAKCQRVFSYSCKLYAPCVRDFLLTIRAAAVVTVCFVCGTDSHLSIKNSWLATLASHLFDIQFTFYYTYTLSLIYLTGT